MKRIKSTIVKLALVFFGLNAYGQDWNCGTSLDPVSIDEKVSDCGNTSDTYLNNYRTPGFWTPNNNTPLKTIRVNFVVVQEDDGTGTLIDDAFTNAKFQDLVDSINYSFSHSGDKGYPSTCESNISQITDSKIRILLNDVIFMPNSDVFHNGSNNANSTLTAVHLYEPESVKAFNIILVDEPVNGTPYWGYYYPYSPSGHDCIISEGHHNAAGLDYNIRVGHFVHEISHGLGLHHTYDGTEPRDINHFDFLADVWGNCSEPLMSDASNPCYPASGSPCVPVPNEVCYLKALCFFNNFSGNNPLMSGKYPAKYISALQAGRYHRTLSLIDNVYVINNKDMHQYIVEKYPYDQNFIIDNNQNWDFTIKLYQNIEILPGNTLTIKCKVLMPINGKIIVHPGAKLIIDGGTVTCAHDGELWSGIEVLGDVNDLTQSYSIQGHAYFFNNAIVENAQVAVRNFGTNAEGKKLWNTTGGIIQASNSTFYNNRKSAEFIRYQRKDANGNLMNDRSYFSTTDFSWDNDLRDTPLNHITMYKTYGVRITGCNFSDDRINVQSEWITNQNPSSCGIRSIDAKFYVQAKCNSTNLLNCVGDLTTNPTGWTPTTFKNLDFGIYASNTSTENSILVDRSVFENNLYGIELVSSNSPTITRNHFNYSATKEYMAGYKYGIHAIRTLEFRIEQNKFENTNSGNPTVGIVCSQIGESNVDVYKNTFINLNYANIAQGQNRNYDTPDIENGRYGLQFLCNTNSNNRYDHYVKSTLWGQNQSVINGVRNINGTSTNGSGIEFTQNGLIKEDYFNNSSHSVDFWYENPNTFPLREPIETYNVFKAVADNNHTCPSYFVDKPIIKLPPVKKQELIADFNTAITNLATKTSEYSALVNGGDTDGLMVEISNLAPNNKHQLRQTLLSYSPYLTENVIRAVVDNHPSKYPHWWAFELVLENIEVAKNKEFMNFLANKQYPMPSWMRWTIQWFINNGAYTDNFNKQAELSSLTYNKTFASDFIIRDLKTDTVSTNLDSVEYWISQKNDVLVQTRLVDVNIQKGNYTQALSLLGSIKSSLNSMPAHLQAELIDFMAFKFKLIEIVQQDGGLGNMTDENHIFMTNTANSSTGLAQYQAQEILCFFYNECIDRPFGDDMTKSMVNETPPVEEMPDRELDFKMYPNPANDWVAIEFALSVEPITIMITDINGKLVMTETINKPMYIWETLSIPNGTYIINLINTKNEIVGTEKIIIQH